MLTYLKGQIERITYSNEENGYTIAKVKAYGYQELVTVVGNLLSLNPGEVLNMKGEWSNHPKYGEQFKLVNYETLTPATVHGIKKYLGSGLIKGIGPIMADRIVTKFGEASLNIIETAIDKLREVDGIGNKRIEMIKKAWEEQKEIRNVMLFLQSHNVSSGYATKIFRQYGSKSIEIVKDNPYRLAMDIFGIGFITADKIAENIGFKKDSEKRVEAGILYVLHQLSEEGHVYFPYEPLIEKCKEILKVDRDIIVKAFGTIAFDKRIVMEDLNEDIEDFKENNKAVYLSKYHLCETSIANRIKTLIDTPKSVREIHAEKAIEWVQSQLSITLAEKQKEAIKNAIENKVLVITGGPGTGKSTIISAIIKIFSELRINILLAAPTGRAAKRMSEITGYEAKTIHRLLKFRPGTGEYEFNENNPLKCNVLIVDEASMIDTILMHHLLKAIPIHTTFIMVGDINQLPSVGAGNVLADIIASQVVPVVKLNEIFRQAQESQIIVNAHRINNGLFPVCKNTKDIPSDFYLIEKDNPEEVLKLILELTSNRVPNKFRFDPISDIQVLTPMRKGVVGVANLNIELQKMLNTRTEGITRGGKTLKIGDKVMQIKNNYDKDVFNGDIGKIAGVDNECQQVKITFDDKLVEYDFSDLDEITLAYAISVHKSQGSEFPVIIMPVLMQHYMMLQRNLIYTGITRGKKLVILIGTKKALSIGIKNDKTQRRYTYLRHRLHAVNKQ